MSQFIAPYDNYTCLSGTDVNCGGDVKISMGIIHSGVVYETPAVQYVQNGVFSGFRVATVQLKMGEVVSVTWTATSCNLSACACVTNTADSSYDICGVNCFTDTCLKQINVSQTYDGLDPR